MKTEKRHEKVYLYGKHALKEALLNAPKTVRKAFISPDVRDAELSSLLQTHAIPVAPLTRGKGRDMTGTDAHQGIIATVDTRTLLVPLDAFLKTLDTAKNPAVVVLGEVQDPHNVGAILRSAAAFGLAGVLIPERNQAPVTGTVIKVSAGMAFRIPLVSIGNVNHALRVLKERGFWTYGLAMNGHTPLQDEPFDAPSAFVIGNEGSGIREKTLETCDITLSIPIHPRAESLNASVSAAITFYAWSAKHAEALAS